MKKWIKRWSKWGPSVDPFPQNAPSLQREMVRRVPTLWGQLKMKKRSALSWASSSFSSIRASWKTQMLTLQETCWSFPFVGFVLLESYCNFTMWSLATWASAPAGLLKSSPPPVAPQAFPVTWARWACGFSLDSRTGFNRESLRSASCSP